MIKKKHYKLFKAGKRWCTMAVVTIAAVIGLAATTMTGQAADDVSTTPTVTNTVTATAATNDNTPSQTGTSIKQDQSSMSQQPVTNNANTDVQQPRQIDYRTPVNAGYLDSATNDGRGNVVFSGWHATNEYQQGMNHYIIALDGNNHELYRHEVQTNYRPDVQNVYPHAPISGEGGFTFTLPASRLNNVNSLRLVSRYTKNSNGEPNDGADFWYPTIQTNDGWLDQFRVSGNQIVASGWHVDDQSADMPTHYLILFDQTKGHEITRQVVTNMASADVAKNGYKLVSNANDARFSAFFNITPAMLGDRFVLISRYTSSKDGNSNYSDYWFNNNVLQVRNDRAGYLDQFRVDAAHHQIIASGWHADDAATVYPNHFLILFDKTADHEVARQIVKNFTSADVARSQFGNLYNAGNARFSITFKIDPSMINHQFVLVSRYSNSNNINDYGQYADYWYGNQINLNNNLAWLDTFNESGTHVNVAGWHSDDASMIYPHHFLLLYDLTRGHELSRQEVTNTTSGDVANAYNYILGADHARFSANFTIAPSEEHDALQIISRYSNATNGEGNYSENWITNRMLNLYQNPAWMYQINYTQIQPQGPIGYNVGPGYEGIKTWLIKRRLGTAGGHNEYSYYDGALVKNFQRRHGLPATGWVDLATWEAMGYSRGLWYVIDSYVAPLGARAGSGRQAHIEAMINQAYKYMGKPYLVGSSSSPAYGTDCSGLVMQALYAGGINPTSCSSIYHAFPGNEWNSRNLFADPHFMNVPYSQRQRGDLVFYYEPGTRVIRHVAIYLGNNMVIESWPPRIMVQPIMNGQRSDIAGIRRVFA